MSSPIHQILCCTAAPALSQHSMMRLAHPRRRKKISCVRVYRLPAATYGPHGIDSAGKRAMKHTLVATELASRDQGPLPSPESFEGSYSSVAFIFSRSPALPLASLVAQRRPVGLPVPTSSGTSAAPAAAARSRTAAPPPPSLGCEPRPPSAASLPS